MSPAPSTATVAVGSTVTIFDTLLATVAPPRSGPSIVKHEVSTTACTGRATRVITSAALALAALWNPVVRA